MGIMDKARELKEKQLAESKARDEANARERAWKQEEEDETRQAIHTLLDELEPPFSFDGESILKDGELFLKVKVWRKYGSTLTSECSSEDWDHVVVEATPPGKYAYGEDVYVHGGRFVNDTAKRFSEKLVEILAKHMG